MTNRPKQIGTWTESSVVSYLCDKGYNAKREVLHGRDDQGDIHVWLDPDNLMVIEVKGGRAAEQASMEQLDKWLLEAEREAAAAKADFAVLVTKVAGRGTARIGDWQMHWRAPYGRVTTRLSNIDGWVKVNL